MPQNQSNESVEQAPSVEYVVSQLAQAFAEALVVTFVELGVLDAVAAPND